MFAVVCINEPQRSFFGRRKCAVEMLLSPVKGAAPYKVINVTPGKKGIDWKTVSAAAGCCNSTMLLPDCVLPPANTDIGLFEPSVLPQLILLNTVADMISKSEKQRTSVLIEDRNALLSAYIRRIVPFAAKITVLTDAPEKYVKDTVSIMEEFGASIRICSGVDETEQFDIAVSEKKVGSAGLTLIPCEVKEKLKAEDIPDEYRRMCPEGIDEFLFVCALFECCGLKSAGELTLSQV